MSELTPHRPLTRETHDEWSIEILPPHEQQQYDRLWHVLAQALGLDWKAPVGAPDGHEIADDCAVALWDAGFRVPHLEEPPVSEAADD